MTKEKLASLLAKELRAKKAKLKLNKEEAEKFLSALSESMAKGLVSDRKLIVSNFGSFLVLKYGAKMIKSPRGDGKNFFMPPTDVIKFCPSGKIRERSGSEEIADSDYKKLLGHARFEAEPAAVFAAETLAPEEITAKKNPFEVEIRIMKTDKDFLADDRSPLGKLVKSLLLEFVNSNADSLAISPERFASTIVYSLGGQATEKKIIPRESHTVILQKLNFLAGGSDRLLLFGRNEAKIEKNLTPFGEQIMIEKIT